jgi:polar amino acid transport system substrate-binding protein
MPLTPGGDEASRGAQANPFASSKELALRRSFNNNQRIVEHFALVTLRRQPMKTNFFQKWARDGSLRAAKFVVLVASVCAAAHAGAAATPTGATVVPGTLQIGADLTYPPYDYFAGSTPAGFDPVFMRELAAHLGLKPSFVDTRFENLILGLDSRRFDVVASALYVTPVRAKQIDFVPYLKTGGSLIALSQSNYAPKTPEDLCGKRVSSIKGASWIPKLNAVSKRLCIPAGRGAIEVREFDTSPEATQALLAHAVDAQFEDSAVAQMAVNKLGGVVKITSKTQIYPVVIGLGVRKGNDVLLAQLKSALESMKASGEYVALLKKYNLAEPSSSDVERALSEAKK